MRLYDLCLTHHTSISAIIRRNDHSMIPKMSPSHRRCRLHSSSSIVRMLHCSFSCTSAHNLHCLRVVHKDDISREQLKELLYEEIMSFRPPPMV